MNAPLIATHQGRGTRLTAVGEALLAARAQAGRELAAPLAHSALAASAALESAIVDNRRRVRIASSHDEQVMRLRDSLLAEPREVSLEIVGSEGALKRYRRGDVDVVGFHMPMGELGRTVAAKLIALLDDDTDDVFLLEMRRLGLMSRTEAPCDELADLTAQGLRFVNRQDGSATRLAFDGLLGAAGIAPGAIAGYNDEEYTHTAVAARVVSGDADVGFGAESAALHFGLHFRRMVEERFYLVVQRDFDSSLRQFIAAFCSRLPIADRERMKADEFQPSVAVLKRVHKAGFWKTAAV